MACPVSDGLGGVYSDRGKDRSLTAKAREACINFALAEGHLVSEDADDALLVADEALQSFRQLKDEDSIADTVRLKVRVLLFQDMRREAYALAKQELGRIRSGEERIGEAKMLLSIAEANSEKRGQKNREEALVCATDARALFRKERNKRMEAHALITLLTISLKRAGDVVANTEAAISKGEQALELFKEIGDKRGEALAYHGLAAALFQGKAIKADLAYTDQFESWYDACKRSVETFKDLNLKKLQVFEKICMAQWLMEENPRKAVKIAEEAMNLCQSCDSKQEPAALGIVVQAHLSIKDTSEQWMLQEATLAVKKARAGVERFRAAKDDIGEGCACNALVLALLAKEELGGSIKEGAALKAATEACRAFRKTGDKESEAMMLQLIAQLQLKVEKPDMAYQAAQDLTAISSSLSDQALALEAVYEVHLSNKDFQSALATAKEITQLCMSFGDKKREAVSNLLISNAHYMQGEYQEAVASAREAQAMLHDLGETWSEAGALRIVAEVLAAHKEPEAALRSAERARKLMAEFGKSETLASTNFLCAQLGLLALVASGEMMSEDMQSSATFLAGWRAALESAKAAEAMARELNKKSLTASCLCTLAQVQLANLKVEEALKATEEATSIFKSMGVERNVACVMCIEADIQLIKGSTNKAKNLVEKAIAIFQKHQDERGEFVAQSVMDHILGPPVVQQPQLEYQPPQEQQYTQEQIDAYNAWMAQQQQGAQAPGPEQAVAKRERRELDMANKLDTKNLSREAVVPRLQEMVKSIIDIDEDEDFELDTPLMQVGVTSKTAVELSNALREEVPTMNMPMTLVFDYPSVNSISDLIMDSAT